ncbi:hypothetical protein [Hoylesella nanceiensis]|nr:hypothetical protein [Hoylesella nanceiensis]
MQKEEPFCPSSIAFAHSYTAIGFLPHPKEVKKRPCAKALSRFWAHDHWY